MQSDLWYKTRGVSSISLFLSVKCGEGMSELEIKMPSIIVKIDPKESPKLHT